MALSCFKRLILQARELDDGMLRLSETWKVPSLLFGRFSERTNETDACIETLYKTIAVAQDEMKEILLAMKDGESEEAVGIEKLLQEVKASYDEVDDFCQKFESVFEEYGYEYNECNSTHEDCANNAHNSLSSDDNSTELEHHNGTKMMDIEVEFTPDLCWKRKVRVTNSSTPAQSRNQQNAIATPVITRLSDALKKQSVIRDSEHTQLFTPVNTKPKEPIYSRHFYDIQKRYTKNIAEQL